MGRNIRVTAERILEYDIMAMVATTAATEQEGEKKAFQEVTVMKRGELKSIVKSGTHQLEHRDRATCGH